MYLEILQKKKKKSASSATFPDLRCPRLTLHKGRVRYKNDTLGSVARYRCNSPYRIVGSRVKRQPAVSIKNYPRKIAMKYYTVEKDLLVVSII